MSLSTNGAALFPFFYGALCFALCVAFALATMASVNVETVFVPPILSCANFSHEETILLYSHVVILRRGSPIQSWL